MRHTASTLLAALGVATALALAAPAQAPGARLRVIDGPGHLVQLDQPTALATTLTRWLGARD